MAQRHKAASSSWAQRANTVEDLRPLLERNDREDSERTWALLSSYQLLEIAGIGKGINKQEGEGKIIEVSHELTSQPCALAMSVNRH